MQMHSVEVDNEVFEYLKGRAEPFVDTPNSVLRRELLRDSATQVAPRNGRAGIMPPIEPGTPTALRHVLEVIYLLTNSSRSRPEATHFVAQRDGVAFQTVLDKYCRQLKLTAAEFDALLDEPGREGLRTRLISKFPRHGREIDEFVS